MSNAEKILALLQSGDAICDDCISRRTKVTPRQQVNQICRRADMPVTRAQFECALCGKNKLVNRLRKTRAQKVTHASFAQAPAKSLAKERVTPSAVLQSPPRAQTSAETVNIRITSHGTHRTLWGKQVHKLNDIPSHDARRAFECIGGEDGVLQIELHRFTGNAKRKKVGVDFFDAKENFIEGRIYDPRAKICGAQDFRVQVKYPARIADMRKNLERKLSKKGLWAGKPFAH